MGWRLRDRLLLQAYPPQRGQPAEDQADAQKNMADPCNAGECAIREGQSLGHRDLAQPAHAHTDYGQGKTREGEVKGAFQATEFSCLLF